MEYEEWFWGLEGGELGAEGLGSDPEGWAVAPHLELAPAGAAGAAAFVPSAGWGPRPGTIAAASATATVRPSAGAAVAGGGVSLLRMRRTQLAIILAILLAAVVGYQVLALRGPGSRPGFLSASSVVDPGADLALEQAAAIKVAPPVDTGPKPPGRLIIPSIGVDAQIIAVGVDKDGNMAVTNESYDVGWYDQGPVPGDPGDAVIDGHLDWYDTSQAVFYNLKSVQVGDAVQVQRLDGTTKSFKVTGVKTVAYNASVPGLFAAGGPARISLITCGGTWSRALNQYVSRVIVDATLVS